MLTFEFTMNVIGLLAVMVASGFVGFKFRSAHIAKHRVLVNQLEKEMINNHAEILTLQKEHITLEMKFNRLKKAEEITPVVRAEEKMQEVPSRISMLNKEMLPPLNENYQLNYNKVLNTQAQEVHIQY